MFVMVRPIVSITMKVLALSVKIYSCSRVKLLQYVDELAVRWLESLMPVNLDSQTLHVPLGMRTDGNRCNQIPLTQRRNVKLG